MFSKRASVHRLFQATPGDPGPPPLRADGEARALGRWRGADLSRGLAAGAGGAASWGTGAMPWSAPGGARDAGALALLAPPGRNALPRTSHLGPFLLSEMGALRGRRPWGSPALQLGGAVERRERDLWV